MSYREVLDATKHQDDKVGRFLTAIAFLTAATITFGTRSDVLDIRYAVDGLLPLPALLFAGFLLLVVIAVVFLLMALGQALRPPTGKKESYLFFLLIARLPIEQWRARWSDGVRTADLQRAITADLVAESYNIAVRAEKKYRRTGEAQTVFTVALLLFGLGTALTTNALIGPDKVRAAWDLRSRVVTSGFLSTFGLTLGYAWLASEQTVTKGWSRPAAYGLCLTGAAFPVAVLVWRGDAVAVVAAVLLLGEAWCWLNFLPNDNQLRGLMAVVSAILALGAAWSIISGADRWGLAIALASVVLLEVPRFLSATFRPAPAGPALP